MKRMLALLIFYGASAGAQPLSLATYLEQVKTQNPQARSLVDGVQIAELRLEEADVPLSSQLYAEYNLADSKDEPYTPVSPPRVKENRWKLGVRDQTTFGLSTDVFFESRNITYIGANSQFFKLTDFYDARGGIEFRQSLWSNSFGAATRAERAAQKAASRLQLLEQKFELKNLLTRAENTYWSLVSYNQIIKLQEENVERAVKLYNWMKNRARLRLVDDVDALQAEASKDTRELELMQSKDERAALMRSFNTLRGAESDAVGDLSDLPTAEMLLKEAKNPAKRMSREDFRMIFEKAEASRAQARAARSRIAPNLDLVGGVFANGLDASRNDSYAEVQDGGNAAWSVGIQFSVPLDYSLIGNMKRSYKMQTKAADSLREYATFAEQRAWDDLNKQKSENQQRFQKAVSLEKLQTELVKRERQRLLNGRTTTFQAITFEQNLALAQIQRVRSQLALLQVHNLLKQFEASL